MSDQFPKPGPESALSVALSDKSSEQQLSRLEPVVAEVRARWERAKSYRLYDEKRWAQAYYNFRGKALTSVKFREDEISQAFIKITKVKVLAGYAMIMDILIGNGQIPISVDPSPDPIGVSDTVHVPANSPVSQDGGQPQQPADASGFNLGYDGDGDDLQPGETMLDRLGSWLSKRFKGANFQEGPGFAGDVTKHPAEISAAKMQKKIHDQLEESNFRFHLQQVVFEMCLFGTGVMKGPFAELKEYPKWDDKQQYAPIKKIVPKIEYVPLFHFYVDPDAYNLMDADYVIQRHKLTRTQLNALKKRPFFRDTAIDAAVASGPNYVRMWYDNEINDNDARNNSPERYEVLEYWGTISADMLDEYDITIPAQAEDQDEYQVNIWVCGDNLLRVVLNPFTPHRIPYMVTPYEINPYSIYGIGIGENMTDAQHLMNGFVRLAVDNAALAGNMVFEIDETNLVPGQDLKITTGKVFRRAGGPPGQAIFSHSFKSTAQDNMMMYDKFRMFADESTGIPSYAHGQTGVQNNVSRTASGTSMMMNAAGNTIKSVIQNIDAYLLERIGKDHFAFNMQFDPDPDIKGDLDVSARGAAGLMQKEVMQQRLMQFLQVCSNPALLPRVNVEYILEEIAKNSELDPDKVCNSPEEARLQAQLLQQMGVTGNGAGAGANPSGVPGLNDASGGGGGNIGVGSPATPGSPQFTGNSQGGTQQPAQQGSPA